MKTAIKILFNVTVCCVLVCTAYADGTYTTSFDSGDFSAGNLNGQDGWSAQTQWQADGVGNISNNNGAFIRAHNTGVLGSTSIGEMMQITTAFTIGDFQTPSDDIASFEEGILQQGMSHQQGVANFGYGIAAGLFYDVGTGNLEFRANQGINETGTSVVTVGTASGLGGTTYTMDTIFTKTAADTWSVVATLNDGATEFALDYIANGQSSDLDTDADGGGTIGGIQALPSGGGSGGVATPPFTSTTVTDFSITVTAIPEPSSAAILIPLGFVAFSRRRR